MSSIPTDDATTQTCLLESDWSCNSTASCVATPDFTRECLESRIPFRTRYSRIQCCLRCCFLYWLKAYNLDSNWLYFHKNGIKQGAHELQSKDAKQSRLDDMLLGSNHEATTPFAARRLTSGQLQWKLIKREEKELSLLLRFKCAYGHCTDTDRYQAYQIIWSANRAGNNATFKPTDWIEVHCGDGCGGYGAGNPWGAYREITLQGIENVLFKKNTFNSSTSLVTSTDCDLPSTESERRLLDHPQLKAWYTVNPSQLNHPKLKAIPIGVQRLKPWLERFRNEPSSGFNQDQRFLNRTTRLLCCCMSRLKNPTDQWWYRGLNPIHRSAFHNDSLALDVKLADDFLDKYRGFVGEYFGRKRRAVIIQHLGTLFPETCGPTAASIHLKPPDYAAAVAHADFVVSPRGKGRACYRTWEALISGSIPIVDEDIHSPAMNMLYGDELPVFRVQDWRTDVTPEKLESYLKWARDNANLRKAYLPYWIAQLTASSS
uniref:RXYLT1 C-terminal domain-containing protein n=1 Tax=Aureoumbra lagunensis TaxID=44058 RepID=A0A7S3JQ34_9STRA